MKFKKKWNRKGSFGYDNIIIIVQMYRKIFMIPGHFQCFYVYEFH